MVSYGCGFDDVTPFRRVEVVLLRHAYIKHHTRAYLPITYRYVQPWGICLSASCVTIICMDPTADNVTRLIAHINALGLEPKEEERKWGHMGALITDAALQPRTNYQTTVWPRANKVWREWPDADTLSGFLKRLDAEDLPSFLKWRRSSPKLPKIQHTAMALDELGVETVADLATRFRDPVLEAETRKTLRRVKHVGPKTLDYIAILTGSNNHVAVDQHVQAFVADAGVPGLDYDSIGSLVKATADEMGFSPGALDAAIWNHMSTRGKA